MQSHPDRLVFIDETSIKTNLTRLRGRSLCGKRLEMTAPFGAWGTLNRPGFTGDCLVLLKRLYLARSGLHSMPPLPQLVLYIRLVRAGDDC